MDENRRIARFNQQQARSFADAQRTPRERTGRRSAVSLGGGPIAATSILPESGEVRFMDALVNIAVAAVTVIWTATRTATAALEWSVFWILLGSLMAVMGRGELRYGGFAVAAANASYLALRIAQLVRTNPSAGYVAARQVQAAYEAGNYAVAARVAARFLDVTKLA